MACRVFSRASPGSIWPSAVSRPSRISVQRLVRVVEDRGAVLQRQIVFIAAQSLARLSANSSQARKTEEPLDAAPHEPPEPEADGRSVSPSVTVYAVYGQAQHLARRSGSGWHRCRCPISVMSVSTVA